MSKGEPELKRDRDVYRVRLYLGATVGWIAAITLSMGFAALFLSPDWANRLMAIACGLVVVASEIDPTARLPWWARALLALISPILILLNPA